MAETIYDLIQSLDSKDGYLADAWLDRLRAFDFKVGDSARFLAWLPNIKPHLACVRIDLLRGETDLGEPARLLEFHTGGWPGAEDLITAMLGHFWIAYFHTKWCRGGHYTFEIPQTHLNPIPANPASSATRS